MADPIWQISCVGVSIWNTSCKSIGAIQSTLAARTMVSIVAKLFPSRSLISAFHHAPLRWNRRAIGRTEWWTSFAAIAWKARQGYSNWKPVTCDGIMEDNAISNKRTTLSFQYNLPKINEHTFLTSSGMQASSRMDGFYHWCCGGTHTDLRYVAGCSTSGSTASPIAGAAKCGKSVFSKAENSFRNMVIQNKGTLQDMIFCLGIR